MCFSTAASFASGTVLLVVSFYTIQTARAKNNKYLLLACMPMFFGIQQIIEGFVWLGLLGNNLWLLKIAAFGFLFFALAFWPVFSPLSMYFIEEPKATKRKMLLLILVAIGLFAGMAIYLPLLISANPLSAKIIGKSISYSIGNKFENIYTAVYGLVTILPFLIASNAKLKLFAILLIFSAIIANYFYIGRCISVWCFFAAILSLFIVYVMYQLPQHVSDTAS